MASNRRCPHDGGACHHACPPGECWREINGMHLTTPWQGYPLEGHTCPPETAYELTRTQRLRVVLREAVAALSQSGTHVELQDQLGEALRLAEACDPDAQIDKLATFIIDEVPGEPSQSQGAVDTAIRWMRTKLEGKRK